MAARANEGGVSEGTVLWEPTAERKSGSRLAEYMAWLRRERGLEFDSYGALWQWSVTELEAFWSSVWDYFEVRASKPYARVLDRAASGGRVEGARWFPGAELNYAEHCLRRRDDHPAIVQVDEAGHRRTLTYGELARQVSEVAAGLRQVGVGRGDSVAAYLPNVPEAAIAALASASVGAAWSSCAPEFGVRSVVERLRPLGPKVLLAADGYRYGGRTFDTLEAVRQVEAGLPTLKRTFVLSHGGTDRSRGLARGAPWNELRVPGEALTFESVPFDHPLWVLSSSGTTGAPKAMVHGHGNVLIEHLKALAFHKDLTSSDRFFWYTTTGWMMWNFLLSGLLLGATIVLYDGSASHPDMNALWRMAADEGVTSFGVSAPYLTACMKAGIEPGRELDLSALRVVGSTGAPLPPEGFAWVYRHVKRDLLLASTSGGTDVVTAFVGGCPLLPVRAGELQARSLGCKVESWDENGRSLVGEVGELVVTEPMPSMPVRFLADPDGSRLHESYFATYPGVWRHGDWVKITADGGCVIYGRSDATLNRSGVRTGTSEYYSAVEELPEVLDSLVIDTSRLGEEGRLLLFLVLQPGVALDDAFRKRLRAHLRTALSPRHVPDAIVAIPEVPRTLNGKKVEVPVKRILAGTPPEAAASRDALANPGALAVFADLARRGV